MFTAAGRQPAAVYDHNRISGGACVSYAELPGKEGWVKGIMKELFSVFKAHLESEVKGHLIALHEGRREPRCQYLFH